MMGSPSGGGDDERPVRQVTISSFQMGINPVTVGEFRRFINATNYRTDAERSGGGWVRENNQWVQKADANWRNPYFTQNDNHPVVLVSWFDVIEYCNWLSRQEGLTPAYTISGIGNNRTVTWNRSANGYRLPTETEWEYACRAGTTTAYSTGASITTTQANFNNSLGRTTPVGNYAANAWGLHDMHGNVYEWCWDWFGNYPAEAQTDPTGPASGSDRVIRGGSWFSVAQNLRSANRSVDYDPNYRVSYIGFRLSRP